MCSAAIKLSEEHRMLQGHHRSSARLYSRNDTFGSLHLCDRCQRLLSQSPLRRPHCRGLPRIARQKPFRPGQRHTPPREKRRCNLCPARQIFRTTRQSHLSCECAMDRSSLHRPTESSMHAFLDSDSTDVHLLKPACGCKLSIAAMFAWTCNLRNACTRKCCA